jgi:hypothetical protein
MKMFSGIAISVLALAILTPAYAQQEQHEQKEEEKDKPAQEKEKKEQPAKPAKQEEKSAQQQHAQPKAEKQDEKSAQEQNAQPARQEERNGQQQHAQPAQNRGGRIPADRYKANFGTDHRFRVSRGDYDNHRFQYGGYSFGFVGGWPNNWLYTQDVYVVEINGVYYLCNASYPGVNVELSVTL